MRISPLQTTIIAGQTLPRVRLLRHTPCLSSHKAMLICASVSAVVIACGGGSRTRERSHAAFVGEPPNTAPDGGADVPSDSRATPDALTDADSVDSERSSLDVNWRVEVIEVARTAGCDGHAEIRLDLDGDGSPETVRADGCRHTISINGQRQRFSMRGRPRIATFLRGFNADERTEFAREIAEADGFELIAVPLVGGGRGVLVNFAAHQVACDEDCGGLRVGWSRQMTFRYVQRQLERAHSCDADLATTIAARAESPEPFRIDGCTHQVHFRGQRIALPPILSETQRLHYSVSPSRVPGLLSIEHHPSDRATTLYLDTDPLQWISEDEHERRLMAEFDRRRWATCNPNAEVQVDLDGDGNPDTLHYDGCSHTFTWDGRELGRRPTELSNVIPHHGHGLWIHDGSNQLSEGGLLVIDSHGLHEVVLPAQHEHYCWAPSYEGFFEDDGALLIPLTPFEACRAVARGASAQVLRRNGLSFRGFPGLTARPYALRYRLNSTTFAMERAPGLAILSEDQWTSYSGLLQYQDRFRCDDPEYMAPSGQCAACPFVYAETATGTLQFQGEILRNLRAPELETWQSLQFVTRVENGLIYIRISEEKDEVTFLDAIEVELDGVRHRPMHCAALGPSYCTDDGQYQTLLRGETLDLVFRIDDELEHAAMSVSPVRTVTLWANGHYVPENGIE